MKFLNYLNEEYCATAIRYGDKVPIFVNPTATEIGKMGLSTIRFAADHRSKKLFIWNGDRLIHLDALNWLIGAHEMMTSDEGLDSWRDSNILTGVAYASTGKLDFRTSDQIFYDIKMEYVREMMQKDWNWLKPYFVNMNLLTKIKRKIK